MLRDNTKTSKASAVISQKRNRLKWAVSALIFGAISIASSGSFLLPTRVAALGGAPVKTPKASYAWVSQNTIVGQGIYVSTGNSIAEEYKTITFTDSDVTDSNHTFVGNVGTCKTSKIVVSSSGAAKGTATIGVYAGPKQRGAKPTCTASGVSVSIGNTGNAKKTTTPPQSIGPFSGDKFNWTDSTHIAATGPLNVTFGGGVDSSGTGSYKSGTYSIAGNPHAQCPDTITVDLSASGNPSKGTLAIQQTGAKGCGGGISDSYNITIDNGSSSKAPALAGTTTTNADDTPTCQSNGFSLSWIFCPLITGMADAINGINDSIIQPLLKTRITDTTTDQGSKLFNAWSGFRVYGDIFLVIALLVVVFGQSIGGGIIDAYTAKKILPRLLASAILINLSFYIVGAMADITNVVGAGLDNLIAGPFGQAGAFNLTFSGGTSAIGLTGGAIGVALAIAGSGALLEFAFAFVLLPGLLIFLAIMVTVLLRRGLILLLIIVSPVAFALYCLPNTEKYFRQWWDTLFKTLLVYPIIEAMFALSKVLSVTINDGGKTSGLAASMASLISIAALIVPLALIPFAFRIAGGILGKTHEVLNTASKRGHQAMLGNPNDKNSWRNRVRGNLSNQYSRKQGAVIDRGNELGASRRARAAGSLAKLIRPGNDERMSALMLQAKDREEAMSATGRDALRYAGAGWTLKAGETAPSFLKDIGGTVDHNNDRYIDSKGRQISHSLYNEGKRRHGRTLTDQAQSLEYATRKIQTDGDIANMRESFRRNALEHNWTEKEMGDTWAAATFPHKQAMGSEWYSTPKWGTNAAGQRDVQFQDVSKDPSKYAGFIGEKHKKMQSYQLGATSDADARAMAHVVDTTEEKIASGQPVTQEELNNLAMTHQTLEGMRQRNMLTQDANGEVTVQGASAAANNVFTAIAKNRRYDVEQAVDPTTGKASVNEVNLYDRKQVQQEEDNHNATASTYPKGTVPAFNKSASIAKHTVGHARVTGDIDRPDVTGIGA